MFVVTPKKNESFDRLLRRFSKKVKKSGLILDLRRREYFEKPSVQRRKKKKLQKHSSKPKK
jgi:small subunit ribosomal protein S21